MAKFDEASEREDCRGYCCNCTDAQLRNVYADERDRAKRGGEVGKVARIFAEEARVELARRGLDE